MTSAAIELQKAVYATLVADEALTAALGTGRIHDHAPANVAFPYLTFGRTAVHDWSTDTERGNEHLFTIHVWSKEKGKSQTLEILDLVHSALHDRPLALSSYTLVNMRDEYQEARYNEDHAVYHGILRFRAVTEPAD